MRGESRVKVHGVRWTWAMLASRSLPLNEDVEGKDKKILSRIPQRQRGGLQFNERRYVVYGFLYSFISDEINRVHLSASFLSLALQYPD